MPTSNKSLLKKITYSFSREDVYDENDELVKMQALVVRASLGNIDYQTIAWDETGQDIRECKELLTEQVLQTYEARAEGG